MYSEIIKKSVITADQWAARYGCCTTKARNDLKKLVALGKFKKINVQASFYIPIGKMDPCPPSQNGRKRKTKP